MNLKAAILGVLSEDGTVTAEQFVAQQKVRVDSGGKRRYFYEDSELIYCEGRTYAITNGWGNRAFQNILAEFPDKGVKCEPHQ